MRLSTTAAVTFAAAALASAAAANPNPTPYSDPTAFHALGTIDQVTDFTAYPMGVYTYVGNPHVDGALSIAGSQLEVVGEGSAPDSPVKNSLADAYFTPLTGTISQPGFNLLSLNVGDLSGFADYTFIIHTNLDVFAFGQSAMPADQGFTFHGFLAPTGQYFTSFTISANDNVTMPGIERVELGHTTGVPEPTGWALMILGFASAGAVLRARRRAAVI